MSRATLRGLLYFFFHFFFRVRADARRQCAVGMALASGEGIELSKAA